CARVSAGLAVLGACLALADAGSSAAIAPFQPWAASFVSPSTGFVLGGLGCRLPRRGRLPPPACRPALEATSDGGATWTRLAVPPRAELSSFVDPADAYAVTGVAFADRSNGWLFGPGLWATHDGGRHWSHPAVPAPIG